MQLSLLIRGLFVNVDQIPNGQKIKNPAGIFGAEIDTAVTHGNTKIVMPIGAMQTISFVEIHDVGHVRKVVAWSGHVGVTIFDVDVKLANDGWILPGASRDDEGADELIAFVDAGSLLTQININPATGKVSEGFWCGGFGGRWRRGFGWRVGDGWREGWGWARGNGWRLGWGGGMSGLTEQI